MYIPSIQEIIPETNLIVFTPHFDDFPLSLGGYVLELKARGLLASKQFHILLLFARSNYLARDGLANFDSSLARLQQATGIRLLEDLECLDELLGEHSYRYELFGEQECFVRGKAMADSPIEFPHGMYADFTPEDRQIFKRMQERVRRWAGQPDTALLFPAAIKEHIDHFIVREAGLTIARQLGRSARASFYFIEDKPYAGIQTPAEVDRLEQFVGENHLETRLYPTHPQAVVDLVFKHYPSQVEEVYRQGVLQRARQLQENYNLSDPVECLYAFRP
jgi:hypothetical protein